MSDTILADIKGRAEAITPLMAIATGGVHTAKAKRGVIRLDGPMYVEDPASRVKVLVPCILLSRSANSAAGTRGRRRFGFIRVGFYEADGYEATDEMMALFRAAFADQVFITADSCQYIMKHVDDPILEGQDDTVESGTGVPGASYQASRYRVIAPWEAG